MKLIIQIPVYNEESTIARTLADLPKRIEGISSVETLIIDDGSTDNTVEVARKAGVTHVVRLVSHRGLSTAFLAGIDAALHMGADIIVNTDGDNQYRGADIARLVAPIVRGAAEVVIGDRDVKNSPHMGAGKRLLQRFGSFAVGVASGVRLPDVTSGFRAFSREAAYQLNVFNPFTYTLESILQAGNRNLSMLSVQVGTNPPTRPSRLYSGMLRYVWKSIITIFRMYTVYRPLKTFAMIGALLFLAGLALGIRFLIHYFVGEGGGHIQSLILAAVFLIIGFQTVLIGLVADLISVNRRINEDVLVRLRKLSPPGEERKQRERRPFEKRPPQRPAVAEPPQPAADPQWVWLIDEEKLEDRDRSAASTVPEPAAPFQPRPGRRRRRRRGGFRSGESTAPQSAPPVDETPEEE